MYTKGLRFIADVKHVESEEENEFIASVRHCEIFNAYKNFTLVIDVYLKDKDNRWESISLSKHVFTKVKIQVDLSFSSNIIRKMSNDNPWWKFIVSCEENLYETWNYLQLLTLQRKIKANHKEYFDSKPVCSIIQELFATRVCSDLVFKIKDRDFPVHKPILAVQSKVFKQMFELASKLDTKTFTVDDTTTQAFEDFLAYVYIQKIPEYGEQTVDVFKLAEKYEVRDLMIICEILIMENVSCENAVKMLEFGNSYKKEFIKLLSIQKVKKYFPNQQLPKNLRNHPGKVKELLEAKSKLKHDLKTAETNYRKSLLKAHSRHTKDVNTAKTFYNRTFRGITYKLIAE